MLAKSSQRQLPACWHHQRAYSLKKVKACGIPKGAPLQLDARGRADENLAWVTNHHLPQHLEGAGNISDLLLGQICWQGAIYLFHCL